MVDAALAGEVERPAVRLVDTTFDLARQVGAVLEAAKAAGKRIVDAHVVAACVAFGGGLIVTGDPSDIMELAGGAPAARIRTSATS